MNVADAHAATLHMANAAKEEPTALTKGAPFDGWKGGSLTQEACTKVNRILAVCNGKQDLGSLVALATSAGGLVDDEVRRVACTSLRKHMIESC